MHFRLIHMSESPLLASSVSLVVDNCAESEHKKGCSRSGGLYLEACLCQVYPLGGPLGGVLLSCCAVPTAGTQVGSLCSAALQYAAGFLIEGRRWASASVPLQLPLMLSAPWPWRGDSGCHRLSSVQAQTSALPWMEPEL